jgi:hypothetical protein
MQTFVGYQTFPLKHTDCHTAYYKKQIPCLYHMICQFKWLHIYNAVVRQPWAQIAALREKRAPKGGEVYEDGVETCQISKSNLQQI